MSAQLDPIYTSLTWNFGDGKEHQNANGLNTQHVYRNSGNYDIMLIPDYTPQQFYPKCVDTVIKTVNIDNTILGIEDINNSAEIYPNPSTGQFTLVVTEGTNVKDITLFDILGAEYKIVWKRQNETSFAIEASRLAPATYFVKIETDFGTMTEKVVVVRE